MRFVTDDESKKQYKKFLEKSEKCNFQQSLEWAEVKKPNWIPEVILAEDEEQNIIGTLCVWIRKIPHYNIAITARTAQIPIGLSQLLNTYSIDTSPYGDILAFLHSR